MNHICNLAVAVGYNQMASWRGESPLGRKTGLPWIPRLPQSNPVRGVRGDRTPTARAFSKTGLFDARVRTRVHDARSRVLASSAKKGVKNPCYVVSRK